MISESQKVSYGVQECVKGCDDWTCFFKFEAKCLNSAKQRFYKYVGTHPYYDNCNFRLVMKFEEIIIEETIEENTRLVIIEKKITVYSIIPMQIPPKQVVQKPKSELALI